MLKKLTTKSFIEKANNIHNNKYNYNKTNYIQSKKKVIITCPKHGDYVQRPDTHLEGKGCSKCKNEKIRDRFKSNTQTFIEKSKQIYGNKYDYSKVDYKDIFTKVCITCSIHGDFLQTPARHIEGRGCQKCKRDKNGKYKSLKSKQIFEFQSRKTHNNKYDYSKFNYVNVKTKGIIICNKHGEFYQTPNNHLKGKGCPICKASKGELTIAKILSKYNIKFIPQYRIPNNSWRFRYDFYLPELNILIEFHGIQHFKAKEFFGGEEALKDNQFRDMCKRSLAFDYRILLLEFNYKQLKYLSQDEFESLIINKIKRINHA